MRTSTDVSILSCVEVSRQILRRPNINLGTLIKTIGASNHEVNKSDATIVISAAILEHLGNKKAAEEVLSKSGTVKTFYKNMRLDDDNLRSSFVILLFALAPEFVEMVQTSVKTSIERIQSVTSAPHASTKLIEAMSELEREGSITPTESLSMKRDTLKLEIPSPYDSRFDSIQNTPRDMIDTSDSVSQSGKSKIVNDKSPLNTFGLMRHVKKRQAGVASDFYSDFPNAAKPIEPKINPSRSGLGFKVAESAVTIPESESGFSNVMNNLLPKFPAHGLTIRRKSLNKTEIDHVNRFFRRPTA